ncbi:MAG TPA: hypothetical protein VJ276_20420 [Thermoanaerobaculia bacterium]|nr:hypothetical protein [Thermoanaerobaculia bacterium]
MSLLNPQDRTIFAYNAHAVGFGGRVDMPGADILPSQAAVSLAQSGGEGYVTVRNFSYKGIITFDEASAYVAGSEETGADGVRVFNTVSSVTIRNLNIANMVYVEHLNARLTSRHPEWEYRPNGNGGGRHLIGMPRSEGDITFEGSFISGLSIAGERVSVTLDPLTSCATYETYSGEVREQSTAASFSGTAALTVAEQAAWKDWVASRARKRPKDYRKVKDVIVTSLVKDDVFTTSIPDADADDRAYGNHVFRTGNVIHVREFGKIYVAETIIRPSQRRLGLLRFDLGCAFCGDASAGHVEGNGTPIGP